MHRSSVIAFPQWAGRKHRKGHMTQRGVRSLEDIESDVEDLDLDVSLGDLRFWRGTVGVTFRF